jgi:heptosyltransferase-3
LTRPVIVYRLGSMGDTIVALPCFHKISEYFAGREIIALTNIPVSTKAAALEDILRAGGFIDRSIAYPVGTRNPLRLMNLARTLRATGADTLVHLQGGRGVARAHRDLAFFRATGIRNILGAPLTRDLDQVRVSAETGEEEFEARRLARCLEPLGPIDLDDPAVWDLRLTDLEHATARSVLAPLNGMSFLAVNTGGKVAVKDWGEENWAVTLKQLGAELGVAVVFVGAAEDSERAVALSAAWGGPALDLCGKLAPRETAAVLAQATAFVGHDSGPLHFAASTQTPCVGIFGDFNRPRKWHPYGPRHRIIHDMRGVSAIEPGRVVTEVVAAFTESRDSRPAG